MRITTRKGDDGTTGLLYGGRVRKDSPRIEACGAVDEAQAAMGVARAHAERGGELDTILVGLERDLWVLMADLATDPANRSKLTAGSTLVTDEMVTALEEVMGEVEGSFEMPGGFVVPGETVLAAHLDLARTVVRRAERATLHIDPVPGPALVYLNRLSDLLWVLARWQEGESLPARASRPPDPRGA